MMSECAICRLEVESDAVETNICSSCWPMYGWCQDCGQKNRHCICGFEGCEGYPWGLVTEKKEAGDE